MRTKKVINRAHADEIDYRLIFRSYAFYNAIIDLPPASKQGFADQRERESVVANRARHGSAVRPNPSSWIPRRILSSLWLIIIGTVCADDVLINGLRRARVREAGLRGPRGRPHAFRSVITPRLFVLPFLPDASNSILDPSSYTLQRCMRMHDTAVRKPPP